MPRRDERYTTDDTCEECAKATPCGKGRVGCWTMGNSGMYYSKHPIHHACGQFFPKGGWDLYRRKQNERSK